MTRTAARRFLLLTTVALALVWSSCASSTPKPAAPGAPRYPDYVLPDIPPSLATDARTRTQSEQARARLQANDLRRARSEFGDLLKRLPGFYPADTALGYVALASRDPKEALERFTAAVRRNDRYIPALVGQAEASVALDRDAEAIASLERVVAIDPKRENVRSRLELLRFKLVQSLIELGRQARNAGRYDQARVFFEQALSNSPDSALILHELVLVEKGAGQPAAAETYARRAVKAEPGDAEGQATLAALLADRGSLEEAAAAYERAYALDPRDEWRTESTSLRARIRAAALPPEFAAIASAPSVTRGQVAAAIGIRLEALIAGAPARVTDVATDVRRHWAASWILPVTRAGVMSIFPNHTFQPGATVSRGTLATVVSELARLLARGRAPELAKWQAARPRFPDLPSTHVTYRAAALAVSMGAMTTNTRGEFEAGRPASGADLDAALKRVESLAGR